MVNKSFYTTVTSQAFSPCGNYLFTGDSCGIVSVFHLSKIINPESSLTKDDQKPKNQISIEDTSSTVYSLLSSESSLIVGGIGEIIGYPWKPLKTSKDCKPCFRIDLPKNKDDFHKAEINCLVQSEETGHIYAGCGDNVIYAFDVETQQKIQEFRGHSDYVHCLYNRGNDLISGGEDGLVNIWDTRSKNPVSKLEPYKNSKVARTDLGKWVGAVAMNDDWLLCGGGPRLSLWHLRTLNNSTVFPIDDEGIFVAQFLEDKVLAGGRAKLFYTMNYNGNIISEISTSAVTVYSAVHQQEPYTALCIAGSSPKIDICRNFNYKDQVLNLYWK